MECNHANLTTALEPLAIIRWLKTQKPTLTAPGDADENLVAQYLADVFPGYRFQVVPAYTVYWKTSGVYFRYTNPPAIAKALGSLIMLGSLGRLVGTGTYITQLSQAIGGVPDRRPVEVRQGGFDEFRYYYTAPLTAAPPRRSCSMDEAVEWLIGWDQAVDGLAFREAAYGDIYRSMSREELKQVAAAEIAQR